MVVRSDNGGEFNQEEFGQFWREINIKQELTTVDSPEYNGVAERGLAMIESAALVARVQASELFPGFDIPEKPSLWAQAVSWASDAYHRAATVANSGNRSLHEMFYGEIPQNSPIPFLKPGYCKFKCMNKMDPKAREYFYLGPARNHPRESKRVFVHTAKVIMTRNVTWVHVRSGRSLITRSKPSVAGEGNESGQDQEASAANSESASEDRESVSEGTGGVIETSEAEAAAHHIGEGSNTYTPRARGSQCGVSIDPECMPPGESLADTSAAAGTSHGPDKRYTALSAGEAKRLAKYIPGPPRFSLRGRTRGQERRLTTDAQGLVSLEEELEIAQAAEKEAMLEEAYMADAGVSIEMSTGKN